METLDRPLRAGELARRTGVSKDTLRFYEQKGLLPRPLRLANNYRAYPPETVGRVLWIRRVLAAGFTLDELARILALRERGGIPCRQVRDLGAAKLAEIEERLRDLETTRDRTTHHFRIEPDGGIIQVETNDAADAESRQAIRTHLTEIGRGTLSIDEFQEPVVSLARDATPARAQ